MSVSEEVDVLSRITIFSGVKKDHLSVLAFATEHLEFDVGDIIIKRGDRPDAAFVLLSGEAEAITGEGKGARVLTALRENSFIGESAIINDFPHRITVRAKTRVKVLRISQDLFHRSLTEFPEMAVAIMRVLSRRLDDTMEDLLVIRDQILAETEDG